MVAHCPYFRSSMAFMVCAPFCFMEGSGLFILPLVNGFHNGLCATLLCRWYLIASTSAHQRLSRRFARHIAQRMAAYCSLFRLSMAFTMVCVPSYPGDGSASLVLPLVNIFHGLHAVLLSGWQHIAHSFACRQLSRRFSFSLTERMAAHSPYLRSSTAFTMVYMPYCSVDGAGLLVHPLVNGFSEGLHAVSLRGWQRIAHHSARQQLSQFARRFPLRMERIARSSACQWLSCRFACCIA